MNNKNQFKNAILFVTLVTTMLLVSHTSAECCKPEIMSPAGIGRCYDNSEPTNSWYGMACCGKEDCNTFCCNCDGGCRGH